MGATETSRRSSLRQVRTTALNVALAVAVLGCSSLFAQTGSMEGIVTDPSGASIPGVTVTAKNRDTNVPFQTLTTDTGRYVIPNLVPGSYSVTAALTGFKTKTIADIILQVGQKVRVDIALEVGEITDTIQVTGKAPLLSASSSEIGTIIDQDKVAELPLNGRNFMQLSLLTAGVNTGVASGWTGIQLFSANGVMGEHNNYTMDGIHNREATTNHLIESPSVDAIQEFKAETGLYSAEHQGAGLAIHLVSKSGTNQFHGSLFEYLRNDVLDASGFFPTRGRKKPHLRRNQYGVAVGGPYKRDSHFWFFNLEGEIERRESVLIGRIPTLEQLSGKFETPIKDPFTGKFFPNNQIPADRIDPVLKAILSYYPKPNLAQPNANFVNQSPRTVDGLRFLIKSDHHFSDSDKLFVRFSYQDHEFFNPGDRGIIPGLSGRRDINDTRGLAINYHRAHSATLLNELRLGYTRWILNNEAQAKGTEFAKNLGVLGIELAPGATNDVTLPHRVEIETFAGINTGQTVIQDMNSYEMADNLTWIKGSHSIRIGGSVLQARFKSFSLGGKQHGTGTYSGRFTGHPAADALLDLPVQVLKSGRAPFTHPWQNRIGLFIQNDWQVSPRLTLNLGLRYDLDVPVRYKEKIIQGYEPSIKGLRFLTGVDEASGFDVTGFYRNERPDIPVVFQDAESIYDPDLNNFSPRVGLAYSLGADRKTVIRAGAGIFHAAAPGMTVRGTSSVPPFNPKFDARSDPTCFPQCRISLVLTGAGGLGFTRLPIRLANNFGGRDEFRNPYVEMWSLNVQRALGSDLMVEVGYVGNHALKNLIRVDINQVPIPGPGSVDLRRPIQGFGPILPVSNFGYSYYHGLQIKANKRMSNDRLSFLLAYAVGKVISNGDDLNSPAQQDINCLRCEKSLATFDIPQRFTLSYAYGLPFGRGRGIFSNRPTVLSAFIDGWEIGGIVTLQSGFPFTPRVTAVVGSNTGTDTRPNRVGNGNLPSKEQTPERFWDRSAFQNPRDFTFGTAGRNILRGPGLATWDFSLRKDFRLGFWSEEARLEFRAEMFNVLNRTNFGRPETNISNPNFGKIFTTSSTAREMQLALRLHW